MHLQLSGKIYVCNKKLSNSKAICKYKYTPLFYFLYTTNNTIYSNNLHYMLHKAIYIYVYVVYIAS